MARNYANIMTAIWGRHKDFPQLNANAQRVYLMLQTQSNISAVGVLPLTVRKWSLLASDTDVADIRKGLADLEARAYVFVDEDTEEVLVRAFTEDDKGYGNPKRYRVIMAAAKAIESAKLRAVLAVEFEKLRLPTTDLIPPDTPPDRPRQGQRDSLSGSDEVPTSDEDSDSAIELVFQQVDSLSGSHQDGHAGSHGRRASSSERVVVTQGLYIQPQPSTHENPHPPSRERRSREVVLVVELLGVDDDDARLLVDEVQRLHAPRNLGGYLRTMADSGDLAALLDGLRSQPSPGPQRQIEPPCGECVNRFVEVEPDRWRRCPRCHPLRDVA